MDTIQQGLPIAAWQVGATDADAEDQVAAKRNAPSLRQPFDKLRATAQGGVTVSRKSPCAPFEPSTKMK